MIIKKIQSHVLEFKDVLGEERIVMVLQLTIVEFGAQTV